MCRGGAHDWPFQKMTDRSLSMAIFKSKRNRKGILCRCNDFRFNRWLNTTSIHGIVHVFHGRSPCRRILWTIIFILAVGIVVSQVINRFTLFFSFPTSTTTTFVTKHDGVEFPAITFCNLNPIKKSFADQHNLSMIMGLVFNPSNIEYPINRQQSFLTTCNDSLSHLEEHARSLDFASVIYDQSNARDFIVQCSFGSDIDSDNYYNCTDMFIHETTSLGLCYTFNSHLIVGVLKRKVRNPGEKYGLRVILDINQDDYSTSLNGNAGIKISINKHGSIPNLDSKGILVPPGTNAYIGMRTVRNINKILGRSCVRNNPKFEYYQSEEYSVGVCEANTFAADIDEACNCLYYRTTSNPNLSRNCTINDTCCIAKTGSNPDTRCSEACDTTVYTAQASFAQFPSAAFADELSGILNKSITNIYKDILAVNVYFEDTSMTIIETTNSYNSPDLLSDLGGILGLFLGASLISLLEIGVLVFDEIKDRAWRKSWKRRISVIEHEVFDDHVPEVTGEKEEEIINEENDPNPDHDDNLV